MAYGLDEIIVNTIVGEVAGQSTLGGTYGHTKEWNEEQQPKKHAIERPAEGACAFQTYGLLGLGLLFTLGPLNDSGILDFDELLFL